MIRHCYHREVSVPRGLPEVFEFFSQAENLEKITPPWLKFHLLTSKPIEMVEGATIAYSLRIHGLSVQWLSWIECWDPPFSFVDVQLKGPYRLWRHTHSFVSREGSTVIADSVEFALPFGVLGDIVYRIQVERDIRRIFDYREQRVKERFNSQ